MATLTVVGNLQGFVAKEVKTLADSGFSTACELAGKHAYVVANIDSLTNSKLVCLPRPAISNENQPVDFILTRNFKLILQYGALG